MRSREAEDRRQGEQEGCTLPEVVESRPVYQGKVISMRVDEIALPNGRTATREVVEHSGAVVVVAVDHEERVYMVRQYRHAIGQHLLELPAGCLEPGEDPLEGAKRELREEVGVEAREWKSLGSFYSSPGFANEVLHAFSARGLVEAGPEPDYDEDLSVSKHDLRHLLGNPAEIADAKSLAALFLFVNELDHGNRA